MTVLSAAHRGETNHQRRQKLFFISPSVQDALFYCQLEKSGFSYCKHHLYHHFHCIHHINVLIIIMNIKIIIIIVNWIISGRVEEITMSRVPCSQSSVIQHNSSRDSGARVVEYI